MESRIGTAVTMGLREFRRTPVLLVLLAVLPVYYIGAFMRIVPSGKLPMTIEGEQVVVELSHFVGVLETVIVAALLSGIVGLFLMQSSKAADDRLRLAGYRSRDLIVSRVGLLTAGGLLVSVVSLGVILTSYIPESIPAFVAATVLTALTYGVIGVIVGVVLDRLAGVYVLLFAPTVDMFLFQNPMATDSSAWMSILPGHYVTKATMDAAFTAGVTAENFVGATGYLLVLLLVGISVFHQATAVE
jgi:ABC-2 type transport system permease protein